jgi:hypothetical protein
LLVSFSDKAYLTRVDWTLLVSFSDKAYLTRVDWTLLVSFSDKKSKLRETPAKNAMLRMLKMKHKKYITNYVQILHR